MSILKSTVLLVVFVLLQSCFYDVSQESSNKQVIRCLKNEDCPVNFGCYTVEKRCVSLPQECLKSTENQLVAIPDGNSCSLSGIENSLCLAGSCVVSSCGDGYLDSDYEQCDLGDKNSNQSSTCTEHCKKPVCGDGFLQAGEACDDGNDSESDGCLNNCAFSTCGDGVLQGEEECDDGNDSESDACLSTCLHSFCGDGFLQAGEECDDRNQENGDSCTNTCKKPACGDGFLQAGEACDDGNEISGDGCKNDCSKIEICGDGFVDQGEACDDANDNPADRCDQCGVKTWSFEVLSGLGESGGNPLHTDIGEIKALYMALDGTIYFANDCQIFQLSADRQTVTRTAGQKKCGFSGDGGLAAFAQFDHISSIFVTELGEVFVADSLNHRIRKIDEERKIQTVAGAGFFEFVFSYSNFYTIGGYGGDGDLAVSAYINQPQDIFVDSGRIFIADTLNNRIRMVDEEGIITTIVGTGDDEYTEDGIEATSAQLVRPTSVFVADAKIYIADTGHHRIRMVDEEGIITTIAGTGEPDPSNFVEGDSAVESNFSSFANIYVDSGVVYFFGRSSLGSAVYKIDSEGKIKRVAGSDVQQNNALPFNTLNQECKQNLEPDSSIKLLDIVLKASLFVMEQGKLIIADGHSLVKETENNKFKGFICPVLNKAIDIKNLLLTAHSIVHHQGDLYISNGLGIFKIDNAQKEVSQIAGTVLKYDLGDNEDDIPIFSMDSDPLKNSFLNITTMKSYNNELYFVDKLRRQIFKINNYGKLALVAGSQSIQLGDVQTSALESFIAPIDFAIENGKIYFSEKYTNVEQSYSRISMVDENGMLHTLAGNNGFGFTEDGSLAVNSSVSPSSITVYEDEVYFVDQMTMVRKINIEGKLETLAKRDSGVSFEPDGSVSISPTLPFKPKKLRFHQGELYFIDQYKIRKIDLNGEKINIAGEAGESLYLNFDVGYNSLGKIHDGWPASRAGLELVKSFTFADDKLIILDGNRRIRRVDENGMITTVYGENQKYKTQNLQDSALQLAKRLFSLSDGQLLVFQDSGIAISYFDLYTSIKSWAIGYEDGYTLGEDNFPYTVGNRAQSRSHYFRELNNASGIAFDGDQTLYISEGGSGNILAVDMPDIADRETWSIRLFSGEVGEQEHVDGAITEARFVEPAGLSFDLENNRLLVIDKGSYTLRSVDIASGQVSTLFGEIGMSSDYQGYLKNPSSVVVGKDGALFISDTGSNKVIRLQGNGVFENVVLGTGEKGSGGEGRPARGFPVNAPQSMDVDAYGNLYVTSTTSVRLVLANQFGEVKNDAKVLTIFGKQPSVSAIENNTHCISGLTIRATGVVEISDECQGYIIELTQN